MTTRPPFWSTSTSQRRFRQEPMRAPAHGVERQHGRTGGADEACQSRAVQRSVTPLDNARTIYGQGVEDLTAGGGRERHLASARVRAQHNEERLSPWPVGLVPGPLDNQCLASRHCTTPDLDGDAHKLGAPSVDRRLTGAVSAQDLPSGRVHDLVDSASSCHAASLPKLRTSHDRPCNGGRPVAAHGNNGASPRPDRGPGATNGPASSAGRSTSSSRSQRVPGRRAAHPRPAMPSS